MTPYETLQAGMSLEIYDAALSYIPIVYGLPTTVPCAGPKFCPEVIRKSCKKKVRIDARGTSRGHCGTLLGFPLAQRAANIQNVSSWTADQGPLETPNLRKVGQRRPNASQDCVQNLMSESCSKKFPTSVGKVMLYWTLDVVKT